MLLSDQFGREVLVQFDLAEVGTAHFSKDGFCQLGFPRIVGEENAAEYFQVADAGSVGFDPWSGEAVLLHVFGPVFLVFGRLRDRRVYYPMV